MYPAHRFQQAKTTGANRNSNRNICRPFLNPPGYRSHFGSRYNSGRCARAALSFFLCKVNSRRWHLFVLRLLPSTTDFETLGPQPLSPQRETRGRKINRPKTLKRFSPCTLICPWRANGQQRGTLPLPNPTYFSTQNPNP